MAGTTTYLGISYPTNTDYVKDGANAIQTVATGFDSAVAIPTYQAQTGTSYTFALTDIGKTVTASNAAASSYTIPPTASVTWVASTTLNVVNLGVGVVTFVAGAGVTVTNSTQTLSQYQSAALVRTGLNAWTVIPFAGGAAPLTDSAVSGTTGSPTTGTYTSGLNYKYYQFTATGSITFSKAGLVDVLVVAAGGSTNQVGIGAGAGGFIYQTDFYVTAAAHTVTIGASVTGGGRGNDSQFRTLTGVGGGRGGSAGLAVGNVGGSAGGTGTTANLIVTGQGNVGGAGGGGGAGGAGGNPAGGVGIANSITGSSVTYAAGGSTTTPVTGTANTGNGAGGSATTNTSGSGVVIIRVLA